MMFGSGPQNKFINPNDRMHPDDRRNLIIFIVLALTVYLSFDHFVLKPKIDAMRTQQLAARGLGDRTVPGDAMAVAKIETRDVVVAAASRITLNNGTMTGTIPLTGNRIDDVMLTKYAQSLGGHDPVEILAPIGTAHAKYAEIGWLGEGNAARLPDKNTVWTVTGNNALLKDHPVVMNWSNGQGLNFQRTLSVDDKYAITVKQTVSNSGTAPVTLFPYALIAENGLPADFVKQNIAHQGPIAYVGDSLHQVKYKTIDDKGEETYSATAGWAGITEKYWLAAVVPQQGEAFKYRFLSTAQDGTTNRRYQADILGAAKTLAPGATVESTMHLFTGAKEVRVLDAYETTLNAPHFDLAVDFGLYYFLTKPFFFALSFFGHATGNFGIAIIIMTILLRGAMYPANNISYRSFAKLKKIAPEMKEIRDRHNNDKPALQKELIALYAREKVNPAAGCLPILLQIPIFFALYKVLSVTIEMRHAPFFGWIHDLSVADPTSVFNLFGLIPFTPPAVLMIGAWPCLMLLSMLLQRQMNPPPQDPVQAQMIRFMPFFMTFIMAKFAAGLVIYWTFSNLLAVAQQAIINTRMGVKVTFFHRPEVEQQLEKQVLEGADVHPGTMMLEQQVEKAVGPITPPKPRRKKKR